MAAIGLTRGQFAIESTRFGPCLVGTWREPTPGRKDLWHDVSLSTVIPHKDLGPDRPTVAGVLRLTSATADVFKNAVLTTTARKLSWHNGTQEVYIRVYAGLVTSDELVIMKATGTVYRDVGFAFTGYDTRLYKASDDSTIWGA